MKERYQRYCCNCQYIGQCLLYCESCSAIYCVSQLELGLRWLHDRAREPCYSHIEVTFYDYVSAYPKVVISSMYGILHKDAINAVELGLRWIHDRAQDDRLKRLQKRRQDPSGRWYG